MRKINVSSVIDKNFMVYFSNGSVGSFKCKEVWGDYYVNNTFGFIVHKSICKILPEWAQ